MKTGNVKLIFKSEGLFLSRLDLQQCLLKSIHTKKPRKPLKIGLHEYTKGLVLK